MPRHCWIRLELVAAQVFVKIKRLFVLRDEGGGIADARGGYAL